MLKLNTYLKKSLNNDISLYLKALDNKNKKEIEILFKRKNKNKSNIEKDIVYKMYKKKQLNYERLKFIIENCTRYLNISSKLIE